MRLCHRCAWIMMTFACSATAATAIAQTPATQAPPRRVATLPGMQPGGSILLPTQWSLRPAGTQIKVGDFPVNIALHPIEPWAVVLHAGWGDHELVSIDLKRQRVVSRVIVDETFYGLCFSPTGDTVYASGAEYEVVHQYAFGDGHLSDHREIRIVAESETFIPTGMRCDASGKVLFVCGAWGDRVAVVPTAEPMQPAERAHVSIDMPKGSYPYGVLPSKDGKRLFVSLWGAAAVAVVDLAQARIAATWPTASHPTEMIETADGRTLYVACADSNTVAVLDTATGKTLEVISSALYAGAPNGSTPNSIALTPDEKVLFIANAENNNVAVIDVGQRGRSRSLGFIPVGWYPTSVRYSAQDNRLYIANGKGLLSLANPDGPNPLNDPPRTVRQYIGSLNRGTISVVNAPSAADMARYTRDAYASSPLRRDFRPAAEPAEANNPIPKQVGDPSPIKYCIYIIKENRTYDQVFGDIEEGNGDANLCIFGDEVTPNHHKLVREFVLLDNFYVESEVSADGHEWSMAAYATDYVEKTWPLNYRGSDFGKIGYTSEGNRAIAAPSSGYIWDRCAEADVSYYSFGEFIENGATPADPGTARVKTLEGHFDPMFRGYDLDYSDQLRADRFIEKLAEFEQTDMPRMIILRLPNDHTYGTRLGKPTPTAMVADNDLALGRVIEALSNSRFWKETAVFVVEDDAQNGSDHVDAHRTVALVVSPWCRRGHVDSSMYSTSSMLRSMELILGLKPMTQFDAAARPMYESFTAAVDVTPYQHVPANVDLEQTNVAGAWGVELSEQLDLSREDAADDLLFNDIIWRSVRGPDSPMPPPVRASFVFADLEDEEEEDGDDD